VKETAKALKALTELSSQVWAEGIRDNLQQPGASAPPATTNGCADCMSTLLGSCKARQSAWHSDHVASSHIPLLLVMAGTSRWQ
jgi:hypothetical protein